MEALEGAEVENNEDLARFCKALPKVVSILETIFL